MPQKIALTGSLKWDDRIKIKNTIFNLKKRFGTELEIFGGGLKDGADADIKKFSLEFDIDFLEMPPYNYQWNPHCAEPPYMYNKSYNSKYIYMRNEKMAKECGVLILFRLKDDTAPHLDHLIERFQKKNKKILVIN